MSRSRNFQWQTLGLLLLTSVAGGGAHGAVVFDVDGAGGAFSPTTTDGIDIFPGNALAVNAVPISVGETFELRYQAEVNFVSQNAGATQVPVPIGDDNSSFEYTIVATLQEQVQSVQDPDLDGFSETITFAHLSGVFSLYYDDTPDANDLSANAGTGYDDGVLVAQGTIQPGEANFTINEPGDAVRLDQFGDDDLPGIQTVDGFGSANVVATFNVTNLNSDFFPNLDLGQIQLNMTLEAPFDNNNPSLLVGGIAPNYGADGVNGFGVGPPGTEDFHFEADGNASFEPVPIPGTLFLLAIGLGFIGLRSRA